MSVPSVCDLLYVFVCPPSLFLTVRPSIYVPVCPSICVPPSMFCLSDLPSMFLSQSMLQSFTHTFLMTSPLSFLTNTLPCVASCMWVCRSLLNTSPPPLQEPPGPKQPVAKRYSTVWPYQIRVFEEWVGLELHSIVSQEQDPWFAHETCYSYRSSCVMVWE